MPGSSNSFRWGARKPELLPTGCREERLPFDGAPGRKNVFRMNNSKDDFYSTGGGDAISCAQASWAKWGSWSECPVSVNVNGKLLFIKLTLFRKIIIYMNFLGATFGYQSRSRICNGREASRDSKNCPLSELGSVDEKNVSLPSC